MNKLISLLFMFMFSMNVMATGNGESVEFLDEKVAYQMSYESNAPNNELTINWDIADGYYLYKDKISVSSVDKQLELICTPNEVLKNDETYGDSKVYYEYAQVRLLIESTEPATMLLEYQGCADAGLCYPPQEREITYFPTGTENQETNDFDYEADYITFVCQGSEGDEVEAVSLGGFLLVLLMALGGGMILNLMPCVFPVLAMKAMTFVQSAGHAKTENIRHSWAYTVGVVVSFMIVGGALLALKIFGGVDVSWGQQLSNYVVLIVMIYIFFFIGLMLYGYTTVGTSLMGVGQGLTEDTGLKGSFFTGALATLVATPCTGPLMAPPLLFALTQPAHLGMLVFVALGFGMALPMLLIAYIPAVARKMPRPGAWMEVFKQGMSFPMFLAVIWLAGVLIRVSGASDVTIWSFYVATSGVMAIMFMFWPSFLKASARGYGKFFFRTKEIVIALMLMFFAVSNIESKIVEVIAIAVIFVLLIANYALVLSKYSDGMYEIYGKIVHILSKLVIAGYIIVGVPLLLLNPPVKKWENFIDVDIEELVEQGPVYVDVTAEWCITCKANKKASMSSDEFYDIAKQKGVTLVRADFTAADKEILEFLRAHDRVSVPLYVLFVDGEEPVILGQTHSANTVIDVFKTLPDANAEAQLDEESSKNEKLADELGL